MFQLSRLNITNLMESDCLLKSSTLSVIIVSTEVLYNLLPGPLQNYIYFVRSHIHTYIEAMDCSTSPHVFI